MNTETLPTPATAPSLREISVDVFRQAMRHIPGSVAVVTTELDGQRYGMTATAVSSVSAEPPQLLVCINRAARSAGMISKAGKFGVSHLAADQESAARDFSNPRMTADERFAGSEWITTPMGVPLLAGAEVVFGCSIEEEIHSGTHTIFIGRIRDAHYRANRSLLYKDGSFIGLTSTGGN